MGVISLSDSKATSDPETGLLYLINRYYDPATGQFLSVDPLEGLTQQPYQYASDNPVNNTDPNGLVTTAMDGGDSGYPVLTSVAIPSRQECVDLINYLDGLLGRGHNPARKAQWEEVYQANKQLLAKCKKLYRLTWKRPQSRPHGLFGWTPPSWLPAPSQPPSWLKVVDPDPVLAP